MRLPLRRQILLPMVGILLLTVGLASALNAWLATRRVDQQIERQLADVAATLSSGNFPLEENVLRQTRGLTGSEFVVSSLAGQPLAASDARLSSLVEPSHANFADVKKWLVDSANGQPLLRRVVTIDRRSVGGERLHLHVFYPREKWRAAYVSAIWPPLAIGGAAMLLVAAVAYGIANHVTRPIHQLQLQVARIAQGDFEPIRPPARDDEVRDLAIAVNRMAEQLEGYETRAREQERLSTLGTLGGGIAHQIRNAATGCRIALDLHHRDSNSESEPLVVAKRQLELIESHIQRFLTLGRPAPLALLPVDLSEVVRQAIELVGPMAVHSGTSIQREDKGEPPVINGDARSLEQMLVNLLVNAIDAAARSRVLVGGPAGDRGDIVVRLRGEEGLRQLAVGDPGPGPAAAIVDRLFEPFATDKPGGTGLGLVVAKRIAEDHGGSIRWERRDGRTWFIVELPTTLAPSP